MHNATQIEIIWSIEASGGLKCNAEIQVYLSLLSGKAHVFIQFVRPCGIEFSEGPSLKRLCRTLIQPELSFKRKVRSVESKLLIGRHLSLQLTNRDGPSKLCVEKGGVSPRLPEPIFSVSPSTDQFRSKRLLILVYSTIQE